MIAATFAIACRIRVRAANLAATAAMIAVIVTAAIVIAAAAIAIDVTHNLSLSGGLQAFDSLTEKGRR